MLATSLLLVALAATPSDVVVSVTDPSGGRVPGAAVVVDPDSPKSVAGWTGPLGEAVLSGIDRGEHRVRAIA